jgi:hypothetical protein
MRDNEPKSKPRHVAVLPVLLGPKNTEAATGFTYRWVRDTAARLGVPFVMAGRKRAVRADLFLAALEREQEPAREVRTKPALADPAEQVRALLRRAGAHG